MNPKAYAQYSIRIAVVAIFGLVLSGAVSASEIANPYASGSSIKIVSGTLAGQRVSSENPEITVAPRESIAGSFDISVTNTGYSNAVFPIAATPTWGTHSTSYWLVNDWQKPGTETHTVDVNLKAPATQGTYYIIVAGAWELSASNVMSATNWAVDNDKWNDGNDIAEWSTTEIEKAMSNGLVIADWLTTEGMRKTYVPATAVKVIVTSSTATPIQSDRQSEREKQLQSELERQRQEIEKLKAEQQKSKGISGPSAIVALIAIVSAVWYMSLRRERE